MTPFEHQQQIRANILGSYNLTDPIKKSKEEKPLDGDNGRKDTDVGKTDENKEGKEGL